MKIDAREWAAALVPGLLLGGLLVLLGGLFAATLEPAERAALAAALEPRLALLAMLWLVCAIALGVAGRWAWLRWVAAPARLAEAAGALAATGAQRELAVEGSAGQRALAGAFNALLAQRARLQGDVEARVREASRDVEQEKTRLAALMSELTQSVVVCNLDGRILLYNNRARLQFRALSDAPALAGGAELIGLGRSIYAVFDRKLVAHALESVQQRLARGAANPSAQFVTTTRSGQLLRVQMAAVRAIAAEPEPNAVTGPGATEPGAPALNGFVLMLDNITRDFEDESERDRLLQGLTEGSRASLGNLQAAVELLDDPALDAATRERFLGVVRDEVAAMSARLASLARDNLQSQKTRWPLEDMLGADLVAAAQRRIEALGLRVGASDVDAALWLKVDSFSLLQALACIAGRLGDEYDIRTVELRLTPAAPAGAAQAGTRAHLDLIWTGQAMSTETVIGWETDAMQIGSERLALTVRDVVERHGGAFWFERERVRHRAFFRFLLPLAVEHAELESSLVVRSESRPEYYDFDLFRATGSADAWADRRLVELTYTVFDTETTGLDPAQGDEIIQIGATRIVNGKLRRQESFEQLVDPEREIPAASIPIHGIQPEMVAGQPTLATVLPAFHAFAQDTVLVAHNAAFDMRFLQLKEAATGVRFEQPVLDTLLLSAVVHPQQTSHGLEAIAERLGVPVLGRHTALGDAIVTAEIFLKLVALLAEQGIHTLGQAREAAQRTYYARIKY